MGYKLEGRMTELCDCYVICPCWVGEDPDGGTCDGLLAWHFDSGKIDGVDVSGLTISILNRIPGNALDGNWKAAIFVDDKATDEQHEAILAVYTGKKGGPLADLAQLMGEVVSVDRVPIEFSIDKGKGFLRVGSDISAELEPFQGATGGTTALIDSVFSTIPGSPEYLGKAPSYKARHAALGSNIDLQGRFAIQGNFLFEAA